MELRFTVPTILLHRLIKIRENASDTTGQRLTYLVPLEKLMTKLASFAGETDPSSHCRQRHIQTIYSRS